MRGEEEEGKRNPRRRATQKILWEYLLEKKEILQWKGRWCVGEGNGMEIAVVVLLELGFFYGGSRVGTVGSGDR